MSTYSKEEMEIILANHKKWLDDEEGGERADLSDANLRGANLRGADLRGADLRGADLRGADLRGADLRDANLSDANLSDADLSDANLRGANLRGADLRGTDLSGANLPENTFVVYGYDYFISIENGKNLRAGCQTHSIEAWRSFSKADIGNMDGKCALLFYPKLLDILDFYIGKGERPDWVADMIASVD